MQTSPSSGRIAIIGAGSVGATIAYAAMLRGLASQIVLVDSNHPKCVAEVKDLAHGLRFVPSVRIAAGRLEDCAGSEIVIITAGAKQQPGQSRLDLAQANVAMFRQMIPAIAAAAPEAIVLVVSNPVDVLTYAATRWHPAAADGRLARKDSASASRVLGTGTVLDSSRFVTLIAERLGVSVANVHAQIVGEHGDSELPLWSSANAGNIPLASFQMPGHPGLTESDRERIIAQVRGAAGEIIAAKGATNWAIGLATARIIEAIRRDENAVLTVSRLIEDCHGVSDVCLSLPCIVNRGGAEEPLCIPMDSTEEEAFRKSAEVVKAACRTAGVGIES